MKNNHELVKEWIRKAENDLSVAINTIETMEFPPTDAICFHAQQCAEKYLKAFLVFHEIKFPYTHDLKDIVLLCATKDKQFESLIPEVEPLTPFAAEFRYPGDIMDVPIEEAEEAVRTARKVKEFVGERLPEL